MLKLDDVVPKLRGAVTIDPSGKDYGIKIISNFKEGQLYEQVKRKMDHCLKSIDDFKFFGCKIDGLTGNEIIRLKVDILSNKSLFKAGNCILFSQKDEYCEDLMFFTQANVLLTTKIGESEKERGIFSFVFNNRYESRPEEGRSPVDPEHGQKRRKQIKEAFYKFLQEEVQLIDPPIRDVLFGITRDIALTAARNLPPKSIPVQYRDIPVAACIMLAVDSDQLGELQSVFGDHGLPTEEWEQEYRDEFVRVNGRQPTCKEKYQNKINRKYELRMDAAKNIISKALHPVEKNGELLFDQEEVEKKIQDIKDTYEMQ